MGASVMTEVLIKTAVQIRDRMKEYDGPRKEVAASMRDTGRQAAPHTGGPGASGTFSLACLSMTTLTLTSPLSVLVFDPAGPALGPYLPASPAMPLEGCSHAACMTSSWHRPRSSPPSGLVLSICLRPRLRCLARSSRSFLLSSFIPASMGSVRIVHSRAPN